MFESGHSFRGLSKKACLVREASEKRTSWILGFSVTHGKRGPQSLTFCNPFAFPLTKPLGAASNHFMTGPRRSHFLVLLIGTLSPISAVASKAESPFWGSLSPGRHPIGIEVRTVYDSTRPYSTEQRRGRPVQLVVYYPAKAKTGEALSYENLLYQTCVPGQPALTALAKKDCLALVVTSLREQDPTLGETEASRRMSENLAARLGAQSASGRFPVILFEAGLTSDTLTFFNLAEFLSSHGFVAISIPSIGFSQGHPLAFDIPSMESKMADLEVAVSALKDIPSADATRVAIAAWSVGGVSATLLQVRHSEVFCFISLDSALGYEYGPKLLRSSSLFELGRMKVPLLHFTGKKPNQVNVPKDFSLLQQAPTQVYLAEVEGLNHSGFTSLGGVLLYLHGGDSEAHAFWAANSAVARLTLDFIKISLKRGNSNSRILSSLKKTADKRVVTLSVLSAHDSR
jgi:hypothetical protein